MSDEFNLDSKPTSITAVPGFRAGVASCGLAESGDDVAVLYSDSDSACGTAALSRNAVAAASIRVSSPRAAAGGIRAVVLNAGASNCCTGEDGYRAAREIIAAVSTHLEVTQDRILIASTGPIGRKLDLGVAFSGLDKACAYARDKGDADPATVLAPAGSQQRAASGTGTIEDKEFKVAGIANAAILDAEDAPSRIVILATDACIKPTCLRELVSPIAEATLGRWAVDSGAGTNDILCVISSCTAENEMLEVPLAAEPLRKGLLQVAHQLVVAQAFAGDSSMKLIEVAVAGAASDEDAQAIAQAIASSVPVRIAIHLAAPRWGLILAAAGKAPARVVESRAVLDISGETVFYRGSGIQSPTEALAEKLRDPHVRISLDLGIGESAATLWTSDLSDGEKHRIQRYEDRLDSENVRRKNLEQKIAELEGVAGEVNGLRSKVEMSEKSIAGAEKMHAEREELQEKLDDSEAARKAALKQVKSLGVQLEIAEGKLKKLQGGG